MLFRLAANNWRTYGSIWGKNEIIRLMMDKDGSAMQPCWEQIFETDILNEPTKTVPANVSLEYHSANNWRTYGSIWGKNEIIRLMMDKDVMVLGLTDLLRVTPIQKRTKKPWNWGAVVPKF
jgi:hypothetical protein